MSSEKADIIVFEPSLPITKADLENVADRRRHLREFVQSQMVVDVDYGVIPGTKKPSLYKPGAEKLAQLFGIGVRIVDRQREVDLHQNFAMFTYTMEAYHLRTSMVIAQCEGSCNSQEKKYRTRYSDGAKEETPIGDVMNTLMKMAQKRAYVGAIIQATGASDFYTQDIDDPQDADQLGIKPPPKKAKATINVKSARSTDDGSAPVCCDRPMMVSKYPDANFPDGYWYCTQCKDKKSMGEK